MAAAWHFLASASKERANALALLDFDSVLCRKGPTEQEESEITIVKSPLVPSLAVVIPFRGTNLEKPCGSKHPTLAQRPRSKGKSHVGYSRFDKDG